MSTNKFINSAKKTIEIQADSIASLINQIDKSFAEIGKKVDRKSTRLNSSHSQQSRMPSSA